MRARPDSEKRPIRMIVLVSQIGISMLTSVFLCVFIGNYLSEKTGLEILFPLMLLLGILAGFRSCYKIISRFVKLKK